MTTPGPSLPTAQPMVTLQNRWYNGWIAGFGVSPASFQLSVPAAPLAASDLALWACQNVLPTASLTFNRAAFGAAPFFGEYAAVAGEMQFPPSQFAQDIGEENYQAWTAYLATIQPPPTANQLPELFRDWAIIYAPAVVAVGVADLTETALISDAQQALQPYLGTDALPVDFLGTYELLRQTLSQSPGGSLSFASRTTSPDVENTWTGGVDTGVDGLWRGCPANSRLSRKFSTSQVAVEATFQAYTVWTSTPGAWYDSSLLHLAYSSQTTPPWPENADPSWDQVFGPEGDMRYLIASLMVVDGIQATITSSAAYSAADRQTLLDNAARGLWPFYAPSSGAVSNVVTFGQARGLTIETRTESANPVVLGGNVLGVAQYLGGQ